MSEIKHCWHRFVVILLNSLFVILFKLHMLWWFLLQKLKASGYILYENAADRIQYLTFFKGRFSTVV